MKIWSMRYKTVLPVMSFVGQYAGPREVSDKLTLMTLGKRSTTSSRITHMPMTMAPIQIAMNKT
jgi:hypothetical protein